VELDFADTPDFSNLGPLSGLPIFTTPSELDLGMTVPQSVMFSVYQQINPCWALLGNVGWQNWDQFGKVDVGVDSANPTQLTKDLQYQDTWHVALGAQYQPSDPWLFSAGVAYDSSAVEDEHRTFTTPMGENYRFGLGVQWRVKEAVSLGAAYEFMWAGDMTVEQDSGIRGRVAGAYEDAWFSFFNVNLTWRF
jgi:long-chain fatty acid transport protein